MDINLSPFGPLPILNTMDDQQIQLLQVDLHAQATCREAVLALFPDICPDYLKKIADSCQWNHEAVITYILDQAENGSSYTKQARDLKRKRDEDDLDERELKKQFSKPALRDHARDPNYLTQYVKASKMLLKQAFPQAYAQDVDAVMSENYNTLFSAYITLDKAFSPDTEHPRFRCKKTASRPHERIASKALSSQEKGTQDALDEYDSVKKYHEAKASKKSLTKQHEELESLNLEKAKAEGTMSECQCCWDDVPFNRMVHCDAEQMHLFCYNCARRMAETEIGLSRYTLKCMSMDRCDAGFSLDQKKLFLDEKLLTALGRIETEANLRMAGIEDLETCPFCPYAAEYPPVEENKEFKCENQECGITSCRLCREETHIPRTCEEAVRDTGHSARRDIEEAMSAALIRKCNKCGTPFIKEAGCNKMVCPRCRNIQCYVCSKSCDYAHFNNTPGVVRKGKTCPLNDSVEKRHRDEVRAAEVAARKLAEEKNPNVDASLLDIKISEKVRVDDEQRLYGGHPDAGEARAPPHFVPLPPQVHFLPPELPVGNQNNANNHMLFPNNDALHFIPANPTFPLVGQAYEPFPPIPNFAAGQLAAQPPLGAPITHNLNFPQLLPWLDDQGRLQVAQNQQPQPLALGMPTDIGIAQILQNQPPEMPLEPLLFDHFGQEGLELNFHGDFREPELAFNRPSGLIPQAEVIDLTGDDS